MQEIGRPEADAGRPGRVLVLDREPAGLVAALRSGGFDAASIPAASRLAEVCREAPAAALILSEGPGAASARATARGLGLAVLAVVDDPSAPGRWAEEAEDWVARDSAAAELPSRLRRVLDRRGRGPAVDPGFLALVVHDLRTPLNVVVLSLRMIEQTVPRGDPELDEDLRFVRENVAQLERMLGQLSDYTRLLDEAIEPAPSAFEPMVMAAEAIETWAAKAGTQAPAVTLAPSPDAPAEVVLDRARAQQAISQCLTNAATASGDAPVRVEIGGGPDRCVVRVVVDRPPPALLKPATLSPSAFERIIGIAMERRSLDATIAARISRMFGGAARLEVAEGRDTALVLDWPARLADAGPSRR